MKNSEIVEGAKEVIEKNGWVKHSCYKPDLGYCLMGAGLSAMGVPNGQLIDTGEMSVLDLEEIVLDAIQPGIETDMEVTLFNDISATTKDDVLDALDRAAKYWRDRGE